MSPRLHEVCLLPTGQIRMDLKPGEPGAEEWVYQRRGKGKGNITRAVGPELQLRRKGHRTDRLTPRNAPHRERFRQAVQAWKDATEAMRQAYRDRARQQPITGFMLWMREFTAPPYELTFCPELLLITSGGANLLTSENEPIGIRLPAAVLKTASGCPIKTDQNEWISSK